jgi:hypothetical protein
MKKRLQRRLLFKAGDLERRAPEPQPQSLAQFFAQSPLAKAKINLKRKRDFGRKIEL